MKKFVYKITDKNGMSYIGSTNRPKHRLIEHRCNTLGFDKESMKIEIICETENYEEIEKKYVEIELKNNNKKCLNKTKDGKSGANLIFISDDLIEKKSNIMKKRWQNPEQKKIFLEGIKKSKLKNNVIEMNKKANEVKIAKMQEYIAICKNTGIVFGPYKGYKLAIEETKCSLDSIFRTLKHGNNNRKFYFEYIGEST